MDYRSRPSSVVLMTVLACHSCSGLVGGRLAPAGRARHRSATTCWAKCSRAAAKCSTWTCVVAGAERRAASRDGDFVARVAMSVLVSLRAGARITRVPDSRSPAAPSRSTSAHQPRPPAAETASPRRTGAPRGRLERLRRARRRGSAKLMPPSDCLCPATRRRTRTRPRRGLPRTERAGCNRRGAGEDPNSVNTNGPASKSVS